MPRAVSYRLSFLLLVPLIASSGPAQIAARPVAGEEVMIAGPEPMAVAAGLEIVRKGGTAIDAGVAIGFALAVTLPSAGNLGGGGFMVIRKADGSLLAIDYREMAPAAAHRDMYLDPQGEPVAALSRVGHLASGVPGSVAGLVHVQENHGTLPLATVMEPSIRLAREGFLVSRWLERSLANSAGKLERFDESRRVFLRRGDRWQEGDLIRQPDLARTLDRIAAEGREGFYAGETADLIVAEMERGAGLISHEDLAGYEVEERTPIRGHYRGHEIVSMPPPSSGGVALLQMLGIVEGFPLARWGPGSEASVHHMVEAMRRAFRDRAEHLGDPDFSEIPVEGLLAPTYIDALRARIADHATPSEGVDPWQPEKEQTTHYSVMDGEGNAVACTTTLNGSYGSGVTVTGGGFLLNNEMDDFAAAPGEPNMFGLLQGEANAVGPRRRPLSSMTPTLVLKDGEPVLAIGSPGGPTIINTVFQCIVNVIDHEMNVAQAIATPRFHHQWQPDRIVFEPYGLNPDVRRGLEARGHRLRSRGYWMGDAHGVARDPESGILRGAADPRHGGRAAGF